MGTFLENVRDVASGAFNTITTAATNMKNKLQASAAPTATTLPTTATTSGGSKKRRSKKTKRVRFSKRRRVYKYKTMRRK